MGVRVFRKNIARMVRVGHRIPPVRASFLLRGGVGGYRCHGGSSTAIVPCALGTCAPREGPTLPPGVPVALERPNPRGPRDTPRRDHLEAVNEPTTGRGRSLSRRTGLCGAVSSAWRLLCVDGALGFPVSFSPTLRQALAVWCPGPSLVFHPLRGWWAFRVRSGLLGRYAGRVPFSHSQCTRLPRGCPELSELF